MSEPMNILKNPSLLLRFCFWAFAKRKIWFHDGDDGFVCCAVVYRRFLNHTLVEAHFRVDVLRIPSEKPKEIRDGKVFDFCKHQQKNREGK